MGSLQEFYNKRNKRNSPRRLESRSGVGSPQGIYEVSLVILPKAYIERDVCGGARTFPENTACLQKMLS